MTEEKEALRTFLKQYNDVAHAGAIPQALTANLDGVFPFSESFSIQGV